MLKWFQSRRKSRYQVGDVMPPNEGGNLGGFIKVCPCCNRIDAIFIP